MLRKFLSAALFSAIISVPLAHSAEGLRLDESRALIDSFSEKLSFALKLAMSQGGPAQAMNVCKDIAPQVASELSRNSGAKVNRTSRNFRNPSNIPEQWQLSVLEDFALKFADTNDTQMLEYFNPGNADTPTRYARAIPIKGQCLACHGTNISKEIKQLLDAEYPFDRAIGYQLGELRGAFCVSWPKAGMTR